MTRIWGRPSDPTDAFYLWEVGNYTHHQQTILTHHQQLSSFAHYPKNATIQPAAPTEANPLEPAASTWPSTTACDTHITHLFLVLYRKTHT
jgi:hypothetical protein